MAAFMKSFGKIERLNLLRLVTQILLAVEILTSSNKVSVHGLCIKDEDLTMPVDITVNGNFVYPDDNKYTYKIRSMDGTILFSSEEQEVVPEEPEDSVEPIEPVSENSQDTETGEIIPTDRIIIVIPKEYNTLEEGKLFKSQIVEVSFLYQKKPYTIKKAYRITSFSILVLLLKMLETIMV